MRKWDGSPECRPVAWGLGESENLKPTLVDGRRHDGTEEVVRQVHVRRYVFGGDILEVKNQKKILAENGSAEHRQMTNTKSTFRLS